MTIRGKVILLRSAGSGAIMAGADDRAEAANATPREEAGAAPASPSCNYELVSIWARSSATEPNLIVPWGSLASIDPSV
jgi:hypothetical protein